MKAVGAKQAAYLNKCFAFLPDKTYAWPKVKKAMARMKAADCFLLTREQILKIAKE